MDRGHKHTREFLPVMVNDGWLLREHIKWAADTIWMRKRHPFDRSLIWFRSIKVDQGASPYIFIERSLWFCYQEKRSSQQMFSLIGDCGLLPIDHRCRKVSFRVLTVVGTDVIWKIQRVELVNGMNPSKECDGSGRKEFQRPYRMRQMCI